MEKDMAGDIRYPSGCCTFSSGGGKVFFKGFIGGADSGPPPAGEGPAQTGEKRAAGFSSGVGTPPLSGAAGHAGSGRMCVYRARRRLARRPLSL